MIHSMTKVYIIDTKGVPALPVSLVFWPNYRFDIPEKRLFLKEIMAPYTVPFVEIAKTMEEADFIVVPFDYFFVERHAPEYLARVYTLAKESKKKVLLFDYTDYVDSTPRLPAHAILFRVSAYRHHKQQNEIVMPYFVEDLGARYAIEPKGKGTPLIVGYCGQTQFGSMLKKWRAIAKRMLHLAALYLGRDTNPRVHTRGIFCRNTAIRALRKGGIENRIIERTFYSLHRSGIPIDPKDLRLEYVENLRRCDLALCVRGDANASQRFYETLSASRVPLFLDTDSVLPLEEVISYDDFIIRVPSRDVTRISEYVHAWSEGRRGDVLNEYGRKARHAYETYLRLDRYFAFVFDRARSPYTSILYSDVI